ncbi:MAG TPA: hypothetical protein VF176_04795 [Solirubrobacterales bacterium]
MASIETEPIAPDAGITQKTGRLGATLASTPFLGAVVAILTWPIVWPGPTAGLDASWAAGLYMAHGAGLQFGTEFVFTYGPLGFLQVPVLYDEHLWLLASVYRGFAHVALAISLVWVARRAFPPAVAVLVCYALLVIGYLEGAMVLVAFIWCFVALGNCPPRSVAPLIALGGGLIAAVELLGKLNFGIAIFVLCSLAVLGMPGWRRNVPLFAGTAGISLVGLWLIAGQGLGSVPEFASNALQVLSGYSHAMSVNVSDVDWERPFAVGAMALLLAAALGATLHDPLPRRIASIAIVALFSFFLFKQSFVRQGLGNGSDFFPMMLGAAIAVASRLPASVPRLPPRTPALALTLPLAALTIAALPSPSLWESLKPEHHIDYLRQDLHALLSGSERRRLVADGRQSMQSVYRLDRRSLALLGDRPTDVSPWEIGAAWAYRLNWHPLPVIQGYQAYTPALDQLNADALSGTNAPEAILRQNTNAFARTLGESADRRYPAWDPPATATAMLCHYRATRTTERWQVLERTRNRCGSPRLIRTVRSQTGAQIAIPPPPRPEDVVIARIDGVGVEGWETLRSTLYRARQRTITVDGSRTWRLVPDTAEDGLIMRAPAAVDFPEPFRLAPNAHTVSVQIAGLSPRDIEVQFFAQSAPPTTNCCGESGMWSPDSCDPGACRSAD